MSTFRFSDLLMSFAIGSICLVGPSFGDSWTTSVGGKIWTQTTTTKLGIGLAATPPASPNIRGLLDVRGNSVIGAGYAGNGSVTPPSNGLLVEGNVGIGKMSVSGSDKFTVNNTGSGRIALFQVSGVDKAYIDNSGNSWQSGSLNASHVYSGTGLTVSNGDINLPNGKIVLKSWTMEVPDYVFDEKKYKLKSLPEVERFVKANKHLPEIPSASDMKKNGMDVAEMNLLLLKKVEELTLYVIDQDKKIKNLSARIR